MSDFKLPKFPVDSIHLHSELKTRVQEYFNGTNLPKTDLKQMWVKILILVPGFWAVFFHLILADLPWYIQVPECILLGLFIAAIGFNIMHDGSHGSFSKKSILNQMAGYTGSMLGASIYMWNIKHNMIHHTFTNIEGVDDDIEVGALMKFSPHQKLRGFHRFQYIYFVILYMLLYVFWIFFTDYKKYFTGKIGNFTFKKMNTSEHIRFWLVKLFHAVVFIIVPIIAVGWLPWFIGFIITGFTAGFVLSIVFQMAHTVETTEFPEQAPDQDKLPYEFAVHQLKTTSNFATRSKIVGWFTGGLNFQIEHHLFPKISHIHYPAISKIVRQVCKDHNIPYLEYATLPKAIGAHIRFLKQMGRN